MLSNIQKCLVSERSTGSGLHTLALEQGVQVKLVHFKAAAAGLGHKSTPLEGPRGPLGCLSTLARTHAPVAKRVVERINGGICGGQRGLFCEAQTSGSALDGAIYLDGPLLINESVFVGALGACCALRGDEAISNHLLRPVAPHTTSLAAQCILIDGYHFLVAKNLHDIISLCQSTNIVADDQRRLQHGPHAEVISVFIC